MMILSRRSSESFIQSRRDVFREVGSRNLTEIKGYKCEVSQSVLDTDIHFISFRLMNFMSNLSLDTNKRTDKFKIYLRYSKIMLQNSIRGETLIISKK